MEQTSCSRPVTRTEKISLEKETKEHKNACPETKLRHKGKHWHIQADEVQTSDFTYLRLQQKQLQRTAVAF